VIIDVSINLSRWPFRRLAGDEPATLVAKLRKNNVVEAWAGSFDGVFHKDIAAANARLAEDCRKYGSGLLRPFGSVNPKLPDWREDLRRCIEQHGMRGIRLHPNYHGYKLDDPVFRELIGLAAGKGLVVQLALCMEDERTQHPLMRVPPVDLAPLGEAIAAEPQLKLVVLNCYPQLPLDKLRTLSPRGQVYFDFAMVERVEGLVRLAEQVTLARVLFGSYYPFFYFESALLKVRESGWTEAERKTACEENARRLLNRPG
jgi:predicted TIM-barrel fold metal-dependent hydrolase